MTKHENTQITMIDLFSGIGGFSLAAKWCFGDRLKIVAFCEIDSFCQTILKKRWPEVPIIKDIKNAATELIQYREKIDFITGGFPCQPFSVAGKRKGKKDNRYLWPEMFAVIKAIRPRWIIAENVVGIINMALDTVLFDLESEGYTTGTIIIPACAINAPHRRDRIWIIAHSDDNGYHKQELQELQENSNDLQEKSKISVKISRFTSLANREKSAFHVNDGRSQRWMQSKDIMQDSKVWNYNWLEVAAELCGVDDGLSAWMDGLELSAARHRLERIKALGNAIVPQIAYIIFEMIKQIEFMSTDEASHE